MSTADDPWYVRLPNGQTARVPSTDALRIYIENGTLPRESLVRRRGKDPWLPLEAVPVVADLAHEPPSEDGTPVGLAAKLDGLQFKTLGVRGIAQELLTALDNTLVPAKLVVGCLFAMLVLLAGFVVRFVASEIGIGGYWFVDLIVVALKLAVLALGVTILTRYTHREVSEMRSVRWSEATDSLSGTFMQVLFAFLVVPGILLGLIVMFPHIIGWIAPTILGLNLGINLGEMLVSLISLAMLFLSVAMWVLLGVSFLIAPVIVIEDCGFARGLKEWRALLKEQWGSVVLYEAIAITLGFVASLPHLLPVYFATMYGSGLVPPNQLGTVGVNLLYGFAAGPFLAYMAVANVFIYLNLRYEHSSS